MSSDPGLQLDGEQPRPNPGGLVAGSLAALVVVLVAWAMGTWRVGLGLVPPLILGAPVVRVAFDLLTGDLVPTARGIGVAYLATLYKMVCLLVAQAIAIPLLLLVFPIGFLILLFNTLDLVSWLLCGGAGGLSFMPCQCVKLDGSCCVLSVAAFHVIQLGVAYVAVKHGSGLMGVAADWYRRGVTLIEAMGDPG